MRDADRNRTATLERLKGVKKDIVYWNSRDFWKFWCPVFFALPFAAIGCLVLRSAWKGKEGKADSPLHTDASPRWTQSLMLYKDSPVFSHIFVGVSDFDRALKFYTPLMETLGNKLRFCDRERPWAGWQSHPEPRPLFLIGRPYDGQSHVPGNGQMTAFLAADRSTVDKAFATALTLGGTSEGEPGLGLEYHEHYYGAYFRDPDGNKLCVVCHHAEA